MATEPIEEPDYTIITQRIDNSAKKKLNKLRNDLCNYALANGISEPKKGAVLSKVIVAGSDAINGDLKSYFDK